MKKPILFFLMTFLFANYGCSRESGPEEGAATIAVSTHLSLLPESTHFLVYANMKSLKETPFGQGFSERLHRDLRLEEDDESYRDFMEQTGFDFERDAHEIWISGRERGALDHSTNGAIVRGQFHRDKIIDYAKTRRRSRVIEQEFEGHKIYVAEERDGKFAFSFLNDETVVLGNEEWVKSIILQKKSSKNVLDNPSMSKFISQIPEKDYFWGVFDLSDKNWAENIRRRGSPFKGAESLEKMKSLVFYAKVDQKAELVIKGDFATSEEAELFADMLNGFKAMAKMMVSDDKEAVDMLNGIRIQTDGADLQLTMNIDKDFFDKLEEKRQKFEKIEL